MGLPAVVSERRVDEPDEVFPTIPGESFEDRRRRFNEVYKDWIAEENARFERVGNWNEEFRRW